MIVGDAWDQFCKDKKDMVCKAFRDVGITLPIDGSQDHQLQIKGILATSFIIGDGSVDPESESRDSVSGAELETFYRSIPVSGDDTNTLEYTWVIEDYVHTIPSSITPP